MKQKYVLRDLNFAIGEIKAVLLTTPTSPQTGYLHEVKGAIELLVELYIRSAVNELEFLHFSSQLHTRKKAAFEEIAKAA